MTTMKKYFPTLADIAVMVLLFFLVQMIVGAVLRMFGVVAPLTSAVDATDIETYMTEQIALGKHIAIVYPITMILSIGALWVYATIRGGKRVIRVRHSASGFNPSVLLVGVLWLIAAQIMLEPITSLFPKSDGGGIGRGVAACITAVVMAPVFEELLCRGLALEVMRRRWGNIRSIVFSSLFFSVLHAEISTAIVAMVVGAIFGVLYVRTSSLYATIICHSVNNAAAFALICFGVGDVTLKEMLGGGNIYWGVYGVAVAIFVACCIEAYFQVFRRYAIREAKAQESASEVEN